MKNLKNSLSQISLQSEKLLILVLILAFVGFLDATYLTIVHYKGALPGCNLIKGCEIVTTSKYAVFWGVPVSLLGSGYYLGMIVASFWSIQNRSQVVMKYMFLASLGSVVFTGYLVYLMIFAIKALCQ